MRDLLVAVPTRRPAGIGRLHEAMRETCAGDTYLVAGVDDDDRRDYPPGPEYHVAANPGGVAAWINLLTVCRAGQYRYIGTLGDDNVPRTPGWDVRIMAALEHAPFAFGNDLYSLRPPGTLACHIFTRAGVIAALGYLAPHGFRSMYVDNVWTDWGSACGITFLPGVVIEHLHWTVGKAQVDDIYLNSAANMETGRIAYDLYRKRELARDIEIIRGVT